MTFRKSELQQMADAVRVLSIDMVQTANSGHPGAPLGMADIITTIYAKHLQFDRKNPTSDYRDRFILSAGHASAMLYSVLHLAGYKISLEDLKSFRQAGSICAGHPEVNQSIGIETTTGPLGQGFATATGIALAMKIKEARNKKYPKNHTYVLVSDGDLMEGISSEAMSFAGHYNLNNMIVIWDNNKVSIDGNTNKTTSDNITKRFESSNWNTISINGNDIDEIDRAIKTAKQSKKPTFIAARTTIGLYSKNAGTSAAHGSPLDEKDYLSIRKKLGYGDLKKFEVPSEIKKLWLKTGTKLPVVKTEKIRVPEIEKQTSKVSEYFVKKGEPLATRASSKIVLDFVMKKIAKEVVGGSADLTGSVGTFTDYSQDITAKDYSGNYIRFGVREHLMAAAMNGLSLSGLKSYGGTFLIFSDYMRPAIRLSALMKQPTIYIMTHDSLALGEDGPTHQPVEQLTSFRAMPNINVFRPADAIEVAESWDLALKSNETPSILSLSRQKLPLIRKDFGTNKTAMGGYILSEAKGGSKNRKITLLATGSEVSLALEVKKILESKKFGTAVISMPCMELFDKQKQSYCDKVLMPNDSFILAIEAGTSLSWYKYTDAIMGVDEFGESGKGNEVMDLYGFNADFIAERLIKILRK